ncbi:MAG: ribbon-helix-helix protein, CopG family [Gammaproteobacteria bacterium]|nr:ribbon-helix-helix protein, CopG family [Gammaproteobacteria bacterium]MYE83947.1 ribbon-helix-helix protein, CopG family [Gammaproteobacteria bacterium]
MATGRRLRADTASPGPGGSSRRVNISLDRGLLEAIDDEARQRRMTRSAFLATAARHEIQGT